MNFAKPFCNLACGIGISLPDMGNLNGVAWVAAAGSDQIGDLLSLSALHILTLL